MSLKKYTLILDYFYYSTTKFYRRYESKAGESDNRDSAGIIIGSMVSYNILSLIVLIIIFLTEKTDELVDFLSYSAIVFCIVVTIWVRNKYINIRHEEIFDKFKNENPSQTLKRRFIVFSYMILSLGLMIFVIYLGRKYW